MTTDDLRAPVSVAGAVTNGSDRTTGMTAQRTPQVTRAGVCPGSGTGYPARSSITAGCEESSWAALYGLPAFRQPHARVSASELPSRAARPADDAWPQPHVSPCSDFTVLTRVLAGLKRLAD